MDIHYHYGNRRSLAPGAYNVAAWVEYDGGRKTSRRHFVLRVEKGTSTPNALDPDPVEDARQP